MNTKYTFGIAPASTKSVLLNAVSLLVTAGGLLLTCPVEAKSPERVLYSFCAQSNCTDGSSPAGGLLVVSAGNFYGATQSGGAHQAGTVFELTQQQDGSWSETVLYSFCTLANCADGSTPNTGVIPVADSAGNLYGTTWFGGNASCSNGCGTVWEFSPASGKLSVLHSFTGGKDGYYPLTGLTIDVTGNLYGTALAGGTGNCTWNQNGVTATGCGTVFKVASDGTFSTLYRFNGGSDGANPIGTVIVDKNGNLYGTTLAGGMGNCNLLETSGCGTVYKIPAGGGEKQLHAFAGGTADGANPGNFGRGLLRDKTGNLFGTTYDGGSTNAGTVFELAKDGAETWLYSLNGTTDGANPWSGLIADKSWNLYGTTQNGGSNFGGVVFEIAGGSENVLYNSCSKQNCADGVGPLGELVADRKFRHLYSTTPAGGAHSAGVVFSIDVTAVSETR